MKGKKIVVLGSTNTDMVITGKKIPVPGETVSGGTFLMNPGGKGANQAVAVARLSEKKGACVFIAKVGDDLFGRESAERFRKDTIDAKLVVDRKNASGTALILVDSKGQNVISVALGANATLSPKDIRPFEKDIESAAALLMQLETPLETVARAAEVAHAAGVPVILNPAPARKLPQRLLKLVDWITPNESEAELLTGVKVTDGASARSRDHDGLEGRVLRRLRQALPVPQGEGGGLRRGGRHLQRRVRRRACRGASMRGGDRVRAGGVRDLRDASGRAELRSVPPRGRQNAQNSHLTAEARIW